MRPAGAPMPSRSISARSSTRNPTATHRSSSWRRWRDSSSRCRCATFIVGLWGRSPRVIISGVLATCYITALAIRTVINLAYKQFIEPDWQFKTLFELFGGLISTTYLLLCWSALYFGIRYYESQQQQQEAVLKAVALAQESQLKMLRYQLNPHFLFNTLNAISTLILDNQNRTANHAITRLSEFLRYTLDQDPMKKVTLRQEIEALDLYLGTERLRFGDRLRLEYAIEGPALDASCRACCCSLFWKTRSNTPSHRAKAAVVCGSRAARAARCSRSASSMTGRVCATGIRLTSVTASGLRNTRERLAVLYGEHPPLRGSQQPPGAAHRHGSAAGVASPTAPDAVAEPLRI